MEVWVIIKQVFYITKGISINTCVVFLHWYENDILKLNTFLILENC